jgi:hypothetical protein
LSHAQGARAKVNVRAAGKAFGFIVSNPLAEALDDAASVLFGTARIS